MNFPRRLDFAYLLVGMCKNIDVAEFISLCIETEEADCSSLYQNLQVHILVHSTEVTVT